jgi:hypothetical protein
VARTALTSLVSRISAPRLPRSVTSLKRSATSPFFSVIFLEGGQVDVHRREVGVELLHRGAHLLAATVDRGGEGVQRGTEVAGADGAEEREEPAEHLTELHGGGDPLRRDDGAVLQSRATPSSRRHERDEPLPEQGRGQDLGPDLLGDLLRRLRLEPELDHRRVAGLVDVPHLPDEHPVVADVPVLGELEAGPVGVQGHDGEVGEHLVVDRERQRQQERRHDEVHDPGHRQLAVLPWIVVATHHDEHGVIP